MSRVSRVTSERTETCVGVDDGGSGVAEDGDVEGLVINNL